MKLLERHNSMKRKKQTLKLNANEYVLSIGMIVKNEIRCIERCLKSLEVLRNTIKCQLVIADTGSTDGTRQIVEKYADLCFEFKWVNDFSAARNAVLEKCTGIWHMYIDADEYLDEDIEEIVSFLKNEKNHTNYTLASVVQRNYITADISNAQYGDFMATRLARVNKIHRFINEIHESYSIGENETLISLTNTVLHHDGYAKDIENNGKQLKEQRNMELLRKKYEKNSNDIITIVQCIESAYTVNEQEQKFYINAGMKLLQQDKKNCAKKCAVIIYKNAQRMAYNTNSYKIKEWEEFGQENFKDSFYYRLDVSISAATYYFNKEEYDTALFYTDMFINAYNDFTSDKKNLLSIDEGAIVNCNKHSINLMNVVKAACYVKLNKQKQALQLLNNIDIAEINAGTLQNFLLCLQLMPKNNDAKQQMVQITDMYFDCKDDNSNRLMEMSLTCEKAFKHAFKNKNGNDVYSVYTECKGNLGVFANAMQANNIKVSEILENVQSFEHVPEEVIIHAIINKASLPNLFYDEVYTMQNNLVKKISADERIFTEILNWEKCDDHAASIKKLVFLMKLCAEILKNAYWLQIEFQQDIKSETAFNIAKLYNKLALLYINNVYTEQFLQNEDEYVVLPKENYEAILIVNIFKAYENADEINLVRQLKKLLLANNDMLAVVGLLRENLVIKSTNNKNNKASKELLELAEKIKIILSGFDENSPEVQAIIQSEAYEKIKHLL